MKNLIATVAVVALAFGAATAQNSSITVRNGAVNATLVAPGSGGPYTFTLPSGSGTLITTPAGVSGVVNYGTAAPQGTESDGSRFLYNLEYAAGVNANAVGARINVAPTGAGPNLDATALTLIATPLGTGVGRALRLEGGDLSMSPVSFVTTAITGLTADHSTVVFNAGTPQRFERVGSLPTFYGVTAPQSTLGVGTTNLFNVEYSNTVTGSPAGARISSTAIAGNQSATGLTVAAVATGTGTSTALTVSGSGATDAANNYAIDVTAGTVRLSGTSRSVYTPPAVINVGNGDAVPPSATYLELQMNNPGAAALTASLAGGVAGQVIYLRVGKPNYVGSTGIITFNVGDTPVINAAGNAAVNAQVVHAIYTNGKWEVLSNVTAVP